MNYHNYHWCEGCANYFGALGCVLGNEADEEA